MARQCADRRHTAYDRQWHRAEALAAGFSHYLLKPVDAALLLQLVKGEKPTAAALLSDAPRRGYLRVP